MSAPIELPKEIAEMFDDRSRALIIVSVPVAATKAVYEALYERVEAVAKEASEDVALLGGWPVGGQG